MLSAVNRLRAVEQATSSKDDVPPVYLMDEVADLARESLESAQSIAEHIHRNLGHKNPVVKWKALKLVKHLCQKGCSQFQRCMQRYSAAVRELVHYKGEPDAFKGDANNQRVRELAKEVVELLYAHVSQPAQQSSALQGRIQGFGSSTGGPMGSGQTFQTNSSSHSHNNSSGYGGNPRMMAFGSSNAPPPSSGSVLPSWMSNSQPGHHRNGSLGEPVLGLRNSGNSMTNSSSQNPGGFAALGSPASGGSFGGSNLRATSGLGNVATSGNNGEEALVNDMCAGGGLRATPSDHDLRAFVQSVSNLDGLKIAELMMKKLGSDQWQTQLRTLCALEAILNQGLTQACGEVAVMFQSDPAPVLSLTTSSNAQVRQQAAKCLKLLTGEEVDVAAVKKTTAVPDISSTPAAAPTSRPAATPAADLLGDLLGSDPVVSSAPTAAPTIVSTSVVQSQVQKQGAIEDPFAVLEGIVGPAVSSAATNTTTAMPTQNKPTTPPLDDLFASMSVGPTASHANPTQYQNPPGAVGYGMNSQMNTVTAASGGGGGFSSGPAGLNGGFSGLGNSNTGISQQQHHANGLPGFSSNPGFNTQQPGYSQPGHGFNPAFPNMNPGQQPGNNFGNNMMGANGIGMQQPNQFGMNVQQPGMGVGGGMLGFQPMQNPGFTNVGMQHIGGVGGGIGNNANLSAGGANKWQASKTTTAGQDAAFDFVKAAFK